MAPALAVGFWSIGYVGLSAQGSFSLGAHAPAAVTVRGALSFSRRRLRLLWAELAMSKAVEGEHGSRSALKLVASGVEKGQPGAAGHQLPRKKVRGVP